MTPGWELGAPEIPFLKTQNPLSRQRKKSRKFLLAKMRDSTVYTYCNTISTQTTTFIASSYNDMVSFQKVTYDTLVILILKYYSIIVTDRVYSSPIKTERQRQITITAITRLLNAQS